MESFFAGLIGVLVGKGFSKEEASNIVKALRDYLGFEPPVGLKGFVLCDLATGKTKKSAVVVRGKTYNAEALEDLTKYDEVSVLAKSGDALQVARTISHIADISLISVIDEITNIKKIGNIADLLSLSEINYLKNHNFETGDFTFWKVQATDHVSLSSKSTDIYKGSYGLKNEWTGSTASPDLFQDIPDLPISDDVELLIPARRNFGSNAKLKVFWYYDDGESSSESQSLVPTWTVKLFVPTTGKRITRVGLCNDGSTAPTGAIFYDCLKLHRKGTRILENEITSGGGTVSPNNAGVEVVAGTEGEKIRVYDCGFEILAEGVHFFYFGTSTSPTSKRLLTAKLEGTYHQTFVSPRVGDAGESLYLYSAVPETDMPYDLGYVKE